MLNFEEINKKYGVKIRAIASDFHRHPELSMQEHRTSEKIRDLLRAGGAEIVDIGNTTGVVGLIRGGSGPLIALRADIDAIRQTEPSDVPGRSLTPGVMHACGHDVHAAGLLGAAMILTDLKQKLTGDVLLIFQPAEETLSGARYLTDHGLFDRFSPAAIFGLHNLPELPVGTIGVRKGPVMAYKDGFSIRLTGRSGHTSAPQKNIDPTVAIASLILALQTVVSRNVGPLDQAVLSICSIRSGEPFTTTVDDAVITGNIRTLDTGVRDRILERVRTLAVSTSAAFECAADIDIHSITPGVVNSDKLFEVARAAAVSLVGEKNTVTPPVSLASEDFAVLSENHSAFFYFLGAGTPGRPAYGWHSAGFRADAAAPVYGAALLARSVFEAQKMGDA